MLIFLGVLALCILVGIVYVFLSKKTEKAHRIAALIALVTSVQTLADCGVILKIGFTGSVQPDPYPDLLAKPPARDAQNESDLVILVVSLAILVLFLGIIILLGRRELTKIKATSGAEAAGKAQVAPSAAQASGGAAEKGDKEESIDNFDFDASFDIEE
jgi:flagellar basal body-associated protein FliL